MKSPIVVAVAAVCLVACEKRDAPEAAAPEAAVPDSRVQGPGQESAEDTSVEASAGPDEYAIPPADAAAAPMASEDPPIDPNDTGGPQGAPPPPRSP